jgi:hypothetical protein
MYRFTTTRVPGSRTCTSDRGFVNIVIEGRQYDYRTCSRNPPAER